MAQEQRADWRMDQDATINDSTARAQAGVSADVMM